MKYNTVRHTGKFVGGEALDEFCNFVSLYEMDRICCFISKKLSKQEHTVLISYIFLNSKTVEFSALPALNLHFHLQKNNFLKYSPLLFALNSGIRKGDHPVVFCWTTRLSFASWLPCLNIRCISHIRYSILILLSVCEWAILVDMATVVACLYAARCLDIERVFIILPASIQVLAEAEEKVEHPAVSYNREKPGCSTPKNEKRSLNSNRAIYNSSDFSVEQIITSYIYPNLQTSAC